MAVVVAAAFLGFVVVTVLAGRLPAMIFGIYMAASLLAFVAYAIDKSAARGDRRRISERTLHAFSLVGGWPGALMAQRLLRHKTKKRSFQIVFWLTVAINCGGLVWMLLPAGTEFLRTMLA